MRPAFLSFLLCASLLAACDRPPSAGDLPEWSPGDHDKVEESAKQQAGTAKGGGGGGAKGAAAQASTLVEATWKAQCARCHGAMGRGDGPEGPMVQAHDLTREDWQSKVTDPEMAAIIKTGKNKMPKFDLPDEVVQGLVARIRAARGR